MADHLQDCRFELKYLITEEMALKVRDFVRCYIDFDEHCIGKPNCSYRVHSLYLDSDDLTLCRDTVNDVKNRYDLRLRCYDTSPECPVFFEIKRRMNNCILSQRGEVRREFVAHLLSGQLPQEKHLLSQKPKQLIALQRFSELMNRIHAKPQVHICYMREAYISSDEQVRVTIDRDVFCEQNSTPAIRTTMHPLRLFENAVIMELKFTNRFPNWFRDLVRMANVTQQGAAKYVTGIQGLDSA